MTNSMTDNDFKKFKIEKGILVYYNYLKQKFVEMDLTDEDNLRWIAEKLNENQVLCSS